MKFPRCFSLAAALLAGCAAGPKLAPIDARHPASPDAPEAVMSEPGAMPRDDIGPIPGAEPSRLPHHGHTAHGGGAVPKPSAKAGGAYAREKGAFTCPMHPDVRRSRPGRCPKCGMNLVRDSGEGEPEERR